MSLPLHEYSNKIKEDAGDEKDFKGKDDYYLAEGIQPTVNGRLVQITYSLHVSPDIGQCCACSTPQTAIPLFITAPKLPSYKKPKAPKGWDPQVFDQKVLKEVPTVPTKSIDE
jgi:hypothetical protein